MDGVGSVLIVAMVAALWVASLVFGRDTRDPNDWFARTNLQERPPRIDD
jgi:hypothetical protein